MKRQYLFALIIALLLAPSFNAQAQSGGFQARGKEFKDIVKYIETQYRAKKTRIPMLGLANFAVKLIRPAGVKGFKLAVFEDQDFSTRNEIGSFDAVMRDSYRKNWQPLLRMNSKRDGSARTYIYARNNGKDVQFALVTFEEREAVVIEVKFNPDAAARFLENPKIMGISLGNSIRGGGGKMASRGPAGSGGWSDPSTPAFPASPVSFDPNVTPRQRAVIGDQDPAAHGSQSQARPALNASANDENHSPATIAAKPDPVDRDAIRIETRLVNLNVKAVDRNGQPITSLDQADFNVFEDGLKQEVSHFRPVNAPVNLVLLLDLSGSTKRKRKAMGEAAKRFIDALPAKDRVSVVAFTRKYRPLTGFTDDKAALKDSLKAIDDIAGGTAFYDSMWKTLDQLDQLGDARKSIVVLTDGEDESLIGSEETTHTFEELLDRASEEDVTIYPIYFSAQSQNHYDRLGVLFGGGNLIGDNKSRIARTQLEQLAEQTGGELVSAQREEELEAAYRRVASELHTLYSLAYSPDKLKHNGEFRKISVKLNREDAVAKTRRGYFDK